MLIFVNNWLILQNFFMKNVVFIMFFFVALNASSQVSQIEGLDFENWYQNFYNPSYPSKYYWENMPTNIWANSNAATTIVDVFCCERTTDSHSGSYAAHLETKSVYGVPAAGNLFTGKFIANGFNSKALRGVPFTEKLKTMKGYYKYKSVAYSGTPDSCAIYAILSHWDGTKRVEIARAEMYSAENVTTYKQFSIDFQYFSDATPDTIAVVFASSKNGEFYKGGIGSTLLVDDVELILLSGINDESNTYETKTADNFWIFNFRNEAKRDIYVYDISGKLVLNKSLQNSTERLSNSNLSTGIYFYQIIENNKSYSGKLLK